MPEISGQTVGIVGYGDIGRSVAAHVRPMGMHVLALKRHVPVYNADPLVDKIYSSDQRLEMIAQCDYVVAAAPLTPETHGMIGDPEFAAMKQDAVVINVEDCRGPVINEGAMARALTERRIKGAGLDVFEKEPLPADSPLYKLPNVLLSRLRRPFPRLAGNAPCAASSTTSSASAKAEPLVNVVNKKLELLALVRVCFLACPYAPYQSLRVESRAGVGRRFRPANLVSTSETGMREKRLPHHFDRAAIASRTLTFRLFAPLNRHLS